MTQFTVDPEQLMHLARRMDALAVDLAEATMLPGAVAGMFGSDKIDGAMSGFVSHQAEGLRSLHGSVENAGRRLGDAAGAYRAVDGDVGAAAGGPADA
jgi:hypothetical protein